jgi:alanine racemase
VRPGLALYGCLPHPDFSSFVDLRAVMTLRTHILLIKPVAVGGGVGYGHRFRPARPSRVAVVPVGYAQGYPRALGDRAVALVRGSFAPVAGAVSMDYLTLDVTDVPAARVGDEVILWGGRGPDRIDVMDLGAKAGTIGYELLARVSPTIRRETVGSPHHLHSEEDPSP